MVKYMLTWTLMVIGFSEISKVRLVLNNSCNRNGLFFLFLLLLESCYILHAVVFWRGSWVGVATLIGPRL